MQKIFLQPRSRSCPQVGTLESAKSYREKKAKPFWSKIVTVLRSLYRAYLDLKERYDTLQQRFFRERMCTDDLCDRIEDLTEQNKQLAAQNKQSPQALETLKQTFGKEKVESTLEAVNSKNYPGRSTPTNQSYHKNVYNPLR